MVHPSNPPLSSGVVLFTQGDASYEFFRDLGAGRLGERVLLAFVRTPHGLGDCVVLKCIPLPQGEELSEGFQHTRTRLEEEVRLSRYLQHPRIARVHGLVESNRPANDVTDRLRADVGRARRAPGQRE